MLSTWAPFSRERDHRPAESFVALTVTASVRSRIVSPGEKPVIVPEGATAAWPNSRTLLAAMAMGTVPLVPPSRSRAAPAATESVPVPPTLPRVRTPPLARIVP